jgi:hypothetical protein
LFQVTNAFSLERFGFGFRQGWEEQPRQDGNNGDNNEQLNKRKCPKFE